MQRRHHSSLQSASSAAPSCLRYPRVAGAEAFGIELSDIDDNMTFADVGALASFRSKLRVINRITQLPWLELKAAISERRLPSQVVQAGIGRFRPEGKQWKGSNLNDAHLGSLTAYADVTYVDKRTYEAFRTARGKLPILAHFVDALKKPAATQI